ncbi:unnamed protein product [marine sediment metagenome]|uniref:Uncharacterized protein n=1 Tax=marine sediment metagenome TaxID=412755 RepID=X1B177_9ZZZZ
MDSETVSAEIADQLVLLAHELEEHRSLKEANTWTTSSFSGTGMPSTASAFDDGHLNVFRPTAIGNRTESFHDLLHTLIEPFEKEENLRIKFKVVRVAREDATIKTTVDYEASTPRRQHNARWKLTWEKVDESFKITSLQIEDFEEIQSQSTQFQEEGSKRYEHRKQPDAAQAPPGKVAPANDPAGVGSCGSGLRLRAE